MYRETRDAGLTLHSELTVLAEQWRKFVARGKVNPGPAAARNKLHSCEVLTRVEVDLVAQ
jgi:hypothetical protein